MKRLIINMSYMFSNCSKFTNNVNYMNQKS